MVVVAGRFAFIEFRTAGLAIAALQLDKLELAGRAINIGRPKGYVEPPGLMEQAKLSAAQQFMAQMSGGPTQILMLENLGPSSVMKDEEERRLVSVCVCVFSVASCLLYMRLMTWSHHSAVQGRMHTCVCAYDHA